MPSLIMPHFLNFCFFGSVILCVLLTYMTRGGAGGYFASDWLKNDLDFSESTPQKKKILIIEANPIYMNFSESTLWKNRFK